jgi:hypothetical protein
LLSIQSTTTLDAASFTDLTLKTLKDNELDENGLLSQCFDGASVMSGREGGVQARIQAKLKRKIPYVHCYNHKLHLVIVKTTSSIHMVKQYFDQCVLLREFLTHPRVAAIYEGNTVPRLLQQRWSGHLTVTNTIYANFADILHVLNLIRHEQFSGDDVAVSVGLRKVFSKIEFRFSFVLMKRILGLVEPADKCLQRRETGISEAMKVINSTLFALSDLRTEETFLGLQEEAQSLWPESEEEPNPRPKRRRIESTSLRDYIITESTGSNASKPLKAAFYETVDIVCSEMKRRFQDNDDLLTSISSINELDIAKLQPLAALGITIPSKEELTVAKDYLRRNSIVDPFQVRFGTFR